MNVYNWHIFIISIPKEAQTHKCKTYSSNPNSIHHPIQAPNRAPERQHIYILYRHILDNVVNFTQSEGHHHAM